MIISNQNANFPIKDVLLTILVSIPFGIFSFILIDCVYHELNSGRSVESGLIILTVIFTLIFIAFPILGFYAIFSNLSNKGDVVSINILEDGIDIIYNTGTININKKMIKNIDIKIKSMKPVTTYNKGFMWRRSSGEILEYVDIQINTKDEKIYKIRKDLFLFLPNKSIKFFKNLEKALKSYINLYDIEYSDLEVGLGRKKSKAKQLNFSNIISKGLEDSVSLKKSLIVLFVALICAIITYFAINVYIDTYTAQTFTKFAKYNIPKP